jgi:methyl coenzyme M reductase subunit D
MKNILKSAIAMLIVATMMLSATSAFAEEPTEANAEKVAVKLTEAQQIEIATLYKDIFEKKKMVITKYVEYGVMTKEKGQKVIGMMEQRLKKLEQNGYVPNWKKCHKDQKQEKK